MDVSARTPRRWTIWKQTGEWDDVIEGPDAGVANGPGVTVEEVLSDTPTTRGAVDPCREALTDLRDWRELCEMVDAHYSGSLDHQPAYVKRIREALDASPCSEVVSSVWTLRAVTGALKSAIAAHGPITQATAPSAAKRIVGSVTKGDREGSGNG